jgi:hypothetical protein
MFLFAGIFAPEEGPDGRVFIDRDPTQFGLVLDFIRQTQWAFYSHTLCQTTIVCHMPSQSIENHCL